MLVPFHPENQPDSLVWNVFLNFFFWAAKNLKVVCENVRVFHGEGLAAFASV